MTEHDAIKTVAALREGDQIVLVAGNCIGTILAIKDKKYWINWYYPEDKVFSKNTRSYDTLVYCFQKNIVRKRWPRYIKKWREKLETKNK